MHLRINFALSILTLTLLFACDPDGKEPVTGNKQAADSTQVNTQEKQVEINTPDSITANNEVTEKIPHHFICYTNDANPAMAISISYDADENAIAVKYKGQSASMNLSFIKENYLEGGAHPTIENYYTEMFEGKENGSYKLIHSGIWDYAEYTRKKDGEKFSFTIDHDLTVEDGAYRTSPCF